MNASRRINNQISLSNAWINFQSRTLDHKVAIILYSILCGYTVINPSFAFWGPFIFFIITALTKMNAILSSIIFSLVITTIASLINPILGVITSAIFLLMKISNFIKNWRALLAGMFIYFLPLLIVHKIGNYLFYILPIHKMAYNLHLPYSMIQLITCVIIGGFAGLILHITLTWLYRNQYSAKSALATMGSAPLIILLIILPFIINAIGDLIDDVVSACSSTADDFITFSNEFDTIDLDGDGINDNIHHVKGHYRSTPNGGITYVDSHIRTDPNATITDNISYHK